MFDITIIDVAICLILIYAAYSILASIILEFVSMIFRLRARNLLYAFWRIFSDDNTKLKDVMKNHESLLYQFFNHPRIKYLGKHRIKFLNKLWPNYPSYIKPDTFSDIVLDLVKSPGNNNALIQNSNNEKEFNQYFSKLYLDNQNDLINLKQLLEKWYNETMERALGWYKRQTQVIIFIIGLLIAVGFNVDTIDTIDLLFRNSNIRTVITPLMSDLTKYNEKQEQYIAGTDSSSKNFEDMINDAVSIYNIQKSFGSGWSESEYENFKSNMLSHIIGYLLTAFAISFGAPIWFDILNKVVLFKSSLQPKLNKNSLK